MNDQENEMLNNRLVDDEDIETELSLHSGFMSELYDWSRNQDRKENTVSRFVDMGYDLGKADELAEMEIR